VTAVNESEILPILLAATKAYPWNNCLHNKVYAILEELIDTNGESELKEELIKTSKVCEVMTQMAGEHAVNF